METIINKKDKTHIIAQELQHEKLLDIPADMKSLHNLNNLSDVFKVYEYLHNNIKDYAVNFVKSITFDNLDDILKYIPKKDLEIYKKRSPGILTKKFFQQEGICAIDTVAKKLISIPNISNYDFSLSNNTLIFTHTWQNSVWHNYGKPDAEFTNTVMFCKQKMIFKSFHYKKVGLGFGSYGSDNRSDYYSKCFDDNEHRNF